MNEEADAEEMRLHEDAQRDKNWKRWGPYLSERQWGTIREDYSETGDSWSYFPHDHARSRVYRWGEDGLLGICDRQGRLSLAWALWNGKDPILKERLFGLTGLEGNHGEDVKELYYYLDATPTASYLKALYKYPQTEYPYTRLVEENRKRSRFDPEFEVTDTGVFHENRYFDVLVEYAKAAPNDVLARVTIENRGPDAAPIWVLPTLWFRNTWAWGRAGEGYWPKPEITRKEETTLHLEHASLGSMRFELDPLGGPELLFTDNETNVERLFGAPSASRYVKDAFHEYLINGKTRAVNPTFRGTKAAGLYRFVLSRDERVTLRLRLSQDSASHESVAQFDATFAQRIREANEFYARRRPPDQTDEEAHIARQAYAGLLWSKQFYHYVIEHWLEGDPAQARPPAARKKGRNHDWRHLYNRDVISMPDKWEYPWYAAWDVAFHMIPMARIDPQFAKDQLLLFLREWYLHPNGQIPAYEFTFGDANPPVHAWAAWRVYKMSGRRGHRDRQFLARAFQKLLLNFTWWVNRKDNEGDHLFAGGFLGLDNIGLFDRSKPLPTGERLEQADGTAWMAFYASTMMAIALELAQEDRSYADMASKFFEHFVHIVDAMNSLGGTGLWDELDGFYYDQLLWHGQVIPLRIRSIVGITPLFAVEVLEDEAIANLPDFRRRTDWFLQNRADLAKHIAYMESSRHEHVRRLLAVPSRERLVRVLRYLLDENEFLSPFGIRSLSRVHQDHPFVFRFDDTELRVDYAPGESTSGLFGGNSNWRGPVWLPLNFLIVEALERYHYFYGDSLTVECPTGSGRYLPLDEVAHEIAARLARLFLPAPDGARPCHGSDRRYADDPHFRDLVLFYEYFHGENGCGAGAAHQTGWTALVAQSLEHVAQRRAGHEADRSPSSRLAWPLTAR